MEWDEIYEAWLEKRRSVRVPDGFSRALMQRIVEQERAGRLLRRRGGIPSLAEHPVARLAMVLGGSIIGLARVLAVLLLALRT